MIMRFRPANIRLINRRSNLPRLLLALCSTNEKNNSNSNSNSKNNPTFVQNLTGHSISGWQWQQPLPPSEENDRQLGSGIGEADSWPGRSCMTQLHFAPLQERLKESVAS
jgi:hypothetical protein